jgi:hypothetical protein
MLPPPPVSPNKLIRHWQGFEPQRKALTHIIKDAVERIAEDLDRRDYRVTLDSSSDGLGLGVRRARGKLAKPMSGGYLWMWGGISLENDNEVYVSVGIGWVKNLGEHVSTAIRRSLASHGFVEYSEQDDEFYISKNIKQLIGKSQEFEKHSERVTHWLKVQTRMVVLILRRIEKQWC